MPDRDGARVAAVDGDALDDVLAALNATMDRLPGGLEAPDPEVLRARLSRELGALDERWDPDVLEGALADALALVVRRLHALEEASRWDAASGPHVLAGVPRGE
jgi:hypothetical protein